MTGSADDGQTARVSDTPPSITSATRGVDKPTAQGNDLSAAHRTRAVCRAVQRACVTRNWAPVTEVTLANGRRADVLALLPTGDLAVIEVKSGVTDFRSDSKWPEYRAFCDLFYFAVDLDFPQALLPPDTGLLVADGPDATFLREPPRHALPPARRRAVLHRFATLAAARLFALAEPSAAFALRGATWPE